MYFSSKFIITILISAVIGASIPGESSIANQRFGPAYAQKYPDSFLEMPDPIEEGKVLALLIFGGPRSTEQKYETMKKAFAKGMQGYVMEESITWSPTLQDGMYDGKKAKVAVLELPDYTSEDTWRMAELWLNGKNHENRLLIKSYHLEFIESFREDAA